MPYILTKIVLECIEIVVSNISEKMAFRLFFWIAIIFFYYTSFSQIHLCINLYINRINLKGFGFTMSQTLINNQILHLEIICGS